MTTAEPAADAPIGGTPVGAWLDRLAAPSPQPGGGAAAGLVLATGAALTAMAAGYSAEHAGLVPIADAARAAMLAATDADGGLSADLAAAHRLPEDDPERPARIRSAMLAAAGSALDLGRLAAPLVDVLAGVAARGNPVLLPDVAVAAQLLEAGARACAATVRADVTAAARSGEGERAIAWWRAEEGRLVVLADDLLAVARRVADGL